MSVRFGSEGFLQNDTLTRNISEIVNITFGTKHHQNKDLGMNSDLPCPNYVLHLCGAISIHVLLGGNQLDCVLVSAVFH